MILSYQTDFDVLTSYLQTKGFIDPSEKVLELNKPGEGNMNFVTRVRTQKRSIILKQANSFVQKYPQISAPQDRILVEAEFYQTIRSSSQLSTCMPLLLGVDEPNHIIALQDLGVSNDFTFLYQKGKFLTDTELIDLLNFLNRLHHIPLEQLKNYPTNLSLRQLNHKHLFHYMFATDNGFDLNSIQPGLQEIALPYKNNPVLIKQVEELGKSYLAQGDTLIHGDYYPGSWLKAKEKVMIIDPEFSFIGKREFELGVLIAHLKMVEAPAAQLKLIEREYEADRNFSWPCCYQYAGVEMMRRIIGLAQLPLDLSLREKEELLKESCRLIIA